MIRLFTVSLFVVIILLVIFFSYKDSALSYKEAEEKLLSIGQVHLLKDWDNLNPKEQQEMLLQIQNLDASVFLAQQDLIEHPLPGIKEPVNPLTNIAHSGNQEYISRGKQLIREGKAGCIIVAGGQGSRLRSDQPKGMFDVTVIKHKSLFQLFAEKTLAASIQAGLPLQLAIMTSPGNHKDTVTYFKDNHYFHLNEDQISFFTQTELPFLDSNGNLFLERQNKIAQGPNGNGGVLKHFFDSGIWSDWYQRGISYIFFMFIDNALADPFDAELIGSNDIEKSDAAMKCIERINPEEKLGVMVEKDGKIHVVEYSELFPELMVINDDGKLKYPCGHIGLYSFNMDFVKQIAMHYDEIPIHNTWKAVKYLNADNLTVMSAQPIAWKYEKLIFDILPYAQKVNVIMSPRECCFGPLKNEKGPDSLSEVQKALQARDKKIFEEISGTTPPDRPFELSPQFYYPTLEMVEFWKGKKLPETHYIEPFLDKSS